MLEEIDKRLQAKHENYECVHLSGGNLMWHGTWSEYF